VPSGKLYFYRTGTTTPQNTYSDSDLTVANDNPVVANADGTIDTTIYLDNTTGYDYTVVAKDEAGAEIWSKDDVVASNSAAPSFRVIGGTAYIYFQETDATANNTRWRVGANAEAFFIQVGNDAEAAWVTAFQVERTANTVDLITFLAPFLLGSLSSTLTTVRNGSATFSAATTVAVALGVTLPSSTYRVILTARADPVGRLWVASPTTTGFTITNSSSTSITVDWVLLQ
jgi:hypothetical protein